MVHMLLLVGLRQIVVNKELGRPDGTCHSLKNILHFQWLFIENKAKWNPTLSKFQLKLIEFLFISATADQNVLQFMAVQSNKSYMAYKRGTTDKNWH